MKSSWFSHYQQEEDEDSLRSACSELGKGPSSSVFSLVWDNNEAVTYVPTVTLNFITKLISANFTLFLPLLRCGGGVWRPYSAAMSAHLVFTVRLKFSNKETNLLISSESQFSVQYSTLQYSSVLYSSRSAKFRSNFALTLQGEGLA